MAENLPNSGEGNRCSGTDTEDAKQDESKQTHTKTYQNLKRGF